jgi:hypothetical protein
VVVAQVITQDRAVGVPCLVRVWKDPLDRARTPLVSATIPSGEAAEVDVEVESEGSSSTLLWVSFECEGYNARLRAFESSPFDALLLPVVDLGRIWVPKKGMPFRPRGRPRRRAAPTPAPTPAETGDAPAREPTVASPNEAGDPARSTEA